MVLICGSNLSIEELPLSTEIEYSIENDPKKQRSLFAMKIKQGNVVRCYVQNDVEVSRVAPGCEDKIVRFADDDELLGLLSGTPNTVEPAEEPAAPEPVAEAADTASAEKTTEEDIEKAQQVIEEKKAEVVEKEGSGSDNAGEEEKSEVTEAPQAVDEIEEAASTMDVSAVLPTAAAEMVFEDDRLRAKLIATEKLLQQTKACREQAEQEKNELYDYAVEQIDAIVEDYEAKLKDAVSTVEHLKGEIVKASVDDNPLSAFVPFLSKPCGILKQGFSMPDPPHNVITIAAGTTDASQDLCKAIALLAVSGFSGVIVDMTGESMFNVALSNLASKLKAMRNTGGGQLSFNDCVLDPNKNFVDYIRGTVPMQNLVNTNFGNSKVLYSGFYHDIALLAFNWEKFFREVSDPAFCNNQPVVVLLPPATTFVGRYVVSYLGNVINGCIATIGAPSALYSTQVNLKTIPSGRVKVLVMNYIDHQSSNSILGGELNSKYKIKLFKANNFFAIEKPTVQQFETAVAENSKLWSEAFNS